LALETGQIDECHKMPEPGICSERDAAPDPAEVLSGGEDPDCVGGFEGIGGRVSY